MKGCIIGELVLGKPLFYGKQTLDQIVEIIKVIGAPSPNDLEEMKIEEHLIGGIKDLPKFEPKTFEKVESFEKDLMKKGDIFGKRPPFF